MVSELRLEGRGFQAKGTATVKAPSRSLPAVECRVGSRGRQCREVMGADQVQCLVGQSRDLGFTLCEMGNPWRVLSRGGT